MDKCIHTPVKRQYINALFEMAVYHIRRVATILNFLSFISIDIKGLSFNLGRKIFNGFEMAELEIWSISFFDILCNEIEEKCGSVTLKFCHFKASEDFLAKIEWKPLDINTNEWQKVDDCCYLSSLLKSNFKKDFYVLSLYWGMNTFVDHCKYFENLPKETVVI